MNSPARLVILSTLCLALCALFLGPAQPAAAINGVPTFDHIFEIVMENKEYSSIIGSSSAPYINSLAQKYGLATHSYGTTHPSMPNYLSLIAGDTFGITTNCTTCYVNATNLVDQIEGTGKSWKAYMESMPSPCYLGDSGSLYRQKHNPFIYFDDIRKNSTRCQKIVPFSQFSTDLQNNTLPNYIWITPNMCNSMHDCSVSTGDAWLKTWVSKILTSPAWQQNGVLFITFDEGSTSAGCCTYAAGGHIVTLVISPLGKAAFKSSVNYDHYSLLRTIEDAWSLAKLNKAGCSCTATMTDFFAGTTSSNRLVNAGFELDANGDSRPDNWTSNSHFTRSSTVKHGGSYSGRHRATDNASYTVDQTVGNLSAGRAYTFVGYANIPSTGDTFTFKWQVVWRNSSGSTISTSTIKTYSGATTGWNQASATLTAPSGTSSARIRMAVSSLNATIYVDDVAFS